MISKSVRLTGVSLRSFRGPSVMINLTPARSGEPETFAVSPDRGHDASFRNTVGVCVRPGEVID